MAETKKPEAARSFRTGPWMKVHSETHQHPETRVELIRKIERALGGTMVTFFTCFNDEKTMVADDDAEMLESVLTAEDDISKVILFLSSPGGSGLAAERIVNICRQYSKGKFEVIVPHMAKSAATMICFGADTIYMSKTAELGPVDPQVPYFDDQGRQKWLSADEYVRSYENLMEYASGGKYKRIEPFIQQLNRYDARFIEGLKSARKLSESISIRLLQNGMMKGKSDAAIKKAIDVFLTQEKTSSHGRMIDWELAKQCGLKIELIDLQSELWDDIWELYVRCDWAVSNRNRKLMESSQSAVAVGA
jgi:hypothetical protein